MSQNIGRRILIVDDEPAIGHAISSSLRRFGYDVDTCDSVNNAQKKMSHYHYDLIITDLYMPEKSGLDLILDLNRPDVKKQMKILTITGDGPAIEMQDNIPGTIFTDGFLRKPFTTEELKTEVDRLLS